MEHSETGRRKGHEFIGVVEAVGADVHSIKPGDLVVAPFAFSDGTCVFCLEGLHTSCIHGGFFGSDEGGAVGRVGVPQDDSIPASQPTFYDNIAIAGGPAPVRAYVGELLPDVLEGKIEPGRVFDRVTNLDGVPDGYRAMNERKSIKVAIKL